VCPDKSCNIVGLGIPDPAVGTSRAGTGICHVPESDSLPGETQASFMVGECCRDAEELFHDRPETVPRVAVILAMGKGKDTGKTAENEDTGLRSGHRGESS